MLGETASVRDEVGFLIVHQRYADRFFPGTSVLHTRLRYSLFIPLILERLKARGDGGARFTDALRREETALAERLKGERYGVIGRLTLPEASSQPPSYAYWTALSTWGLIDLKPSGRAWSRVELGALAAANQARVLKDDDGRPLAEAVWPVADLPPAPDGWDTDAPLGFDLLPREKQHLAKLLRAVHCPKTNTPSVLARLVGHSVSDVGSCWDRAILDLAGEHRPALLRAGRAASLAAIGRGAYAALVEIQKERDGRAMDSRHRDALAEVLTRHADRAARLDADHLVADLQPDLPGRVEEVLRQTLAWIRGGGTQVSSLLGTYRRAEVQRKGLRARLAEEQRGVDRRIEWQADNHPSPEPLHYRWDRVRLMMRDLEAT